MASRDRIKVTDIHAKRIFRVDFSPTIGNEFKDEHPAIVIRPGNDLGTVIVVPVTSSSVGVGTTKMKITIPHNNVGLDKVSYAYYEGVRQVSFYEGNNPGRFRYTKDSSTGQVVSLSISDDEYNTLMSAVLDTLFTKVSNDYKLKYHEERLTKLSCTKLYDNARILYDYKNTNASREAAEEASEYIYTNAEIKLDYKSHLSNSSKRKGLHKIIESVLNNTFDLGPVEVTEVVYEKEA